MKVMFPKEIIYKGTIHSAFSIFEVNKEDSEKMLKEIGGWKIENTPEKEIKKEESKKKAAPKEDSKPNAEPTQ